MQREAPGGGLGASKAKTIVVRLHDGGTPGDYSSPYAGQILGLLPNRRKERGRGETGLG